MITALAGKAAGVQINKNSSGIGGSAKVSLRGIRSASGDNQPLYVIDKFRKLQLENFLLRVLAETFRLLKIRCHH